MDPNLPWERPGSLNAGTNMELESQMKMLGLDAMEKGAAPRNRMPWLVVFSFSQDELGSLPERLDGPSSIFRNTSNGAIKHVKQSCTMMVNISVADLWKLSSDVIAPVTSRLSPASMA